MNSPLYDRIAGPEDLTAQARIRDAAMRLFGEQGFEKATMRGIAELAGVSPGLPRHHFGSKEGLRDACDAYLAMAVERIDDQYRTDAAPGQVNYVAVAGAALGPYKAYVVRALVEGRASPLFDALVARTEQWLADGDRRRPDPPDIPRKARATVAAAMSLSIALLESHVSRGFGIDVFSPDGEHLLAHVLLDLYSHPYLTPEEAAGMRSRLPVSSRRREGNDD